MLLQYRYSVFQATLDCNLLPEEKSNIAIKIKHWAIDWSFYLCIDNYMVCQISKTACFTTKR
jgi:hypothetical protein